MSTYLRFDIDNYLQLLDLTYEVAQSLKGKPSVDPRWPDCQQLAQRLFNHAATIYYLRLGTECPVPYSSGKGTFFYDFASVIVLTRAALETFLTLFEVFFEPTTEDEFEFNHAFWQLAGFVVREGFIPSDPALKSQIPKLQREIDEMRTRIQKTKKFRSLKRGEQKNVLKGKRKRDWTSLAKAVGFGEQTIRRMYSYYSGYVHADGLSGIQVVTVKTAPEQIEFIEGNMYTVMILLSKMIIEYAKRFPEAEAVCDKNPDAFFQAEIWSGAAERMP
jgi:hypothetical protein